MAPNIYRPPTTQSDPVTKQASYKLIQVNNQRNTMHAVAVERGQQEQELPVSADEITSAILKTIQGKKGLTFSVGKVGTVHLMQRRPYSFKGARVEVTTTFNGAGLPRITLLDEDRDVQVHLTPGNPQLSAKLTRWVRDPSSCKDFSEICFNLG